MDNFYLLQLCCGDFFKYVCVLLCTHTCMCTNMYIKFYGISRILLLGSRVERSIEIKIIEIFILHWKGNSIIFEIIYISTDTMASLRSY